MAASLRSAIPTPRDPKGEAANPAGRDFSGQDLRGFDFSSRDLSGARFVGADLRDATFFEANLDGAEFLQADLRGADLSRARGEHVGFAAADLRGAILMDVRLGHASFTDSRLEDADLRSAQLPNARFRGTALDRAEVHSADLSGADLRNASVTDTSFFAANLRNAAFTGVAHYRTADWTGVNIQGADFTGAYMLRRHVMDANYLHEFRTQGRAAEIAYWVWWATSDCGRSLSRWMVFTFAVIAVFGGFYTSLEVDFGAYETALSPWYFSVVTFTSLGYGDVLPVSSLAKIAVMAEVLLGYTALGGGLSIFAEKMARRA